MRGEGVICRLHGVEVGIVDVFGQGLIDTNGTYHDACTLTILKTTIDALTPLWRVYSNRKPILTRCADYGVRVIWEDTPAFASILPKEYSGV